MLYKYITGIIRYKNCVLYNINGMPDHLHIAASLASNISLSDFVKEIKLSSSNWIKTKKELFPYFRGWAAEYAGLSYGSDALPNLIKYIENQKVHHSQCSFRDEVMNLLNSENIDYDINYFMVDK